VKKELAIVDNRSPGERRYGRVVYVYYELFRSMSSMVSPCESGKEQDMKLVVPEGDGGVERFHTRVHLGFSHEPSPTAWHAVCWAHLFNNPELVCLNVTLPEKDFVCLTKALGLGYELGPYMQLVEPAGIHCLLQAAKRHTTAYIKLL
jgi:hypothetical protein